MCIRTPGHPIAAQTSEKSSEGLDSSRLTEEECRETGRLNCIRMGCASWDSSDSWFFVDGIVDQGLMVHPHLQGRCQSQTQGSSYKELIPGESLV